MHWRNYEASYDVAELEPASREHATYVLQEYFCPVERFEEFVPKMAEILQRHRVNMVNISVRHAHADPGTLLAWARGETFAFVLYYKQRTRDNAKNRVAVWTRELIDAAISRRRRLLPALPAARHARAVPCRLPARARAVRAEGQASIRTFACATCCGTATTRRRCPTGRRRRRRRRSSDFHAVFQDVELHDGFYRFLQTVYRLYPEDRFHTLIKDACERFTSEEDIYRHLQRELPRIKPFLADLRLALPSLAKQKAEMLRQTLQLLGEPQAHRRLPRDRHHRPLRQRAAQARCRSAAGWCWPTARQPTMSPVDIVERGRLRRLGEFVDIGDHDPLPASLADASFDLVSCYIGLHHCAPERIDAFVQSIARVLRAGRCVHPARPRRARRTHARLRRAGAHRLQRRPRRAVGSQCARAPALRADRTLVRSCSSAPACATAARAWRSGTIRPTTC